jgi:hypothetical protein
LESRVISKQPSREEEVEQRKELYAHMGAAMSCAADLEVGLIHALLVLDFLSLSAEAIKQGGLKNFDRPKWERDFDAFFEKHQRLPLGELIKLFTKFAGDGSELVQKLREVLRVRNFLAHHFFREHAASIHNWAGREKMIAKLIHAQSKFQESLDEVEKYVLPTRNRLRFDEERIRQHTEACLAAAQAGEPLPEFEPIARRVS